MSIPRSGPPLTSTRMADPRPLLTVLFVTYLLLLAWIILWKLEPPYIGAAAGLPRPLKLVPFVSTEDDGASTPLELLVNLALFVPFGAYLGLLLPGALGSKVWPAAIILSASSLILEVTQHLLSIGSFDTTDVIVNTAGGMLGFGLLVMIRRRLGPATAPVMVRALTIGTALAVAAVVIVIASPRLCAIHPRTT
ncbi:VanZ family protein [Naasia lichenicola]|uniref:VanZ family protein n=1 Tax=Naasia lichenicola TaxID=2565933 RepID=UPI0018EE78BC|nr:VanZ family protein [Naasia lichenicola]